MGNRYIDFELIKKCPNKYNLKPKDIKRLYVIDWDRLKKITWYNKAMDRPCRCHLIEYGGNFNDFTDFWMGFYYDGEVDYSFSTYEGMCRYNFENFYDGAEIENKFDMQIQYLAMEFLNKLLDEKIVELRDET